MMSTIRLERLQCTAGDWVDGFTELLAAINGTHETRCARPVDVNVNNGHQRITCKASISKVLDTSTSARSTSI